MEEVNNLKICFWNARHLKNKLIETYNFLEKQKIDILMVNETWLKPSDKILSNSNFKLYRLDRLDRGGGGVAIFVNKKIKHQLLPYVNTRVIEAVSIKIYSDVSPFTLYCCYFSSKRTNKVIQSYFRSDIRKICAHDSGDFVVCGDFNARHTHWGCVRANSTGKILYQELLKQYFKVKFPSTHTFYPASGKGCSSMLDLILTNIDHKIDEVHASNDLASDHLAVIFNIKTNTVKFDSENNFPCFSKANWPKFQQIVNSRIALNSSISNAFESSNQIDSGVKLLTDIIDFAKNQSIPRIKTSKHTDLSLPDDILKAIRIKNIWRRKFQRERRPFQKTMYLQLEVYVII